MQIRPQPLSQAWQWFIQTVNLGTGNPRAIFGAAALLVATLMMVLIVGSLLTGLLGGGAGTPPGTALLALTLLLMVGMSILMPILLAGLMYVIREAEAGRPIHAHDVYQPFRQGRAGQLAGFGVVQMLLSALHMWVSAQLAGSEAYAVLLQGPFQNGTTEVAQLPELKHPLLLPLWGLLSSYFNTTVVLLGVALTMLSGLPFLAALKLAARATVRNLPAYLLVACLFAFALGALLLVLSMMGAMLVGALSQIFPPLATLLGLLFMVVILSVTLVVVCGSSYLIWRDTFAGEGDVSSANPPHSGGITV